MDLPKSKHAATTTRRSSETRENSSRFCSRGSRRLCRWGATASEIGYHGSKVKIRRPRVRDRAGKEVSLESWEVLPRLGRSDGGGAMSWRQSIIFAVDCLAVLAAVAIAAPFVLILVSPFIGAFGGFSL